MNHRFISKADKAKETKIELVRKPRHYITVVKYPPADPRDRVDDEYNDDSNQSE